MSRQICATATQIEHALKGSGMSTEEFLQKLTISKTTDYESTNQKDAGPAGRARGADRRSGEI